MLVLLGYLKKDQEEYTINGYAQGTSYTIKYYAENPVISKAAVDSILTDIDSSMSLYQPNSLINEFNASKEGVVLDAQFKAVISKAFEVYKDTQGKFDVTVGPLVQAWGFGSKPITEFPDSLTIRKLLNIVGMDGIELNGNFLKKRLPGIQVDLNGIAQGYSVDVVADYLCSLGITSFVVEIGGELRVKGLKPDGSRRRIGIEGPALTPLAEPQIRHIINITDGAVTTSGNYRKWIQKGAKKIAHLIDPSTGYPLDNQLISVTIYAKDAISADGYDNAVMAMDVKEAIRFIESRGDMEAYLIYHQEDGKIADTLTKGFKKMIVN
ncbi:FAD:protein FMN transferase [Pedobacter immunditicola]|uniref:FAD:protein FMN transferase n=1 Tax=Pedobacter immunditicola TaxID=3133440 RepID=UPI00309F0B2B